MLINIFCLKGWIGDICDVPICRKGCDPMQGYCKRPGECRCNLGFYGEKCDRCIPLPGCQHGYCNVSFECVCNINLFYLHEFEVCTIFFLNLNLFPYRSQRMGWIILLRS